MLQQREVEWAAKRELMESELLAHYKKVTRWLMQQCYGVIVWSVVLMVSGMGSCGVVCWWCGGKHPYCDSVKLIVGGM